MRLFVREEIERHLLLCQDEPDRVAHCREMPPSRRRQLVAVANEIVLRIESLEVVTSTRARCVKLDRVRLSV